ncbi:helix-turn-helix domain-containing protein [Elizabethkingia anophelis]|uniref:helix-turn-helix domain-containing protein n=1 Tax=Elizabethkingia anophelis TaxID=1117645 RepID=UPI0020118398|nr:helix-turn-helix domain-containing protein [Elizabethkingia anophelis]MCL1689620.1 helix-turn-helix domain-containing protein [Elizabethkingia anophelis]
MELNGYTFRNILKRTRRRFALSAGEQALYMELVDICNEEGWRPSFQVSNGELMTALNCTEKTICQWRQSLINAGLLKYSSGKSKRAYGIYDITVNITANNTTNATTNKGVNITTNRSDYNKLNKTSSSFKKEAKWESDDLSFPEEEIEIEKPVIHPDEEKEKSCAKKEKEIIEYFHEQCSLLPKVQIVGETRKKAIKARIKDVGIEKVKEVIKMTSESSFLNGENNRNWSADFDWIMKPTNFTKILEGNYRNRTNGHNQKTISGAGNKGPVQTNQVQRRNNQFTIGDFTVPS